MGSNLRILAVVAATLLVAACGRQLGTVGDLAQQGNAFDQALYANYLERSELEYGEGDYGKSDLFANKARSAAAGEAFGPVNPGDYDLPGETVSEITSARARLVTALDASGRTKLPDQAGRAQVMFDCWVEEQAENRQPDNRHAGPRGRPAWRLSARLRVAAASATDLFGLALIDLVCHQRSAMLFVLCTAGSRAPW